MAFGPVPITTSYIQNGIATDVLGVQTAFSGKGVYQSPMCMYNVMPMLGTSTNIAPVILAAAIQLGVPIPLQTAGAVTFLGQFPTVVLDCHRAPVFSFSGQPANGSFVTYTAYDDRNVAVTATSPNLNAAATQIAATGIWVWVGQKCVSKITSIVFTGVLPAVNVSVGTTSTTIAGAVLGQFGNIGLPFYLPGVSPTDNTRGYIINGSWDNTGLNTTTQVEPGNDWRQGPAGNNGIASSSPPTYPTAASQDARGYVILPSAPTAVLAPVAPVLTANTGRVLSIYYYVYGADSYLQTQLQNNLSGPSQLVGTIPVVAGGLSIPTLVTQDEVGMQFPGSLTITTDGS